MNIKRVLLWVMLGSLALAAAAGAMAALTGSTDTFWRVVLTCVLTAVAAGVFIPLSRLLDKDRSRPAGLCIVGGIVIEYLLILALIWDWFGLSGRREEALCVTAVLFLGLAVAGAILVYLLGGSSTKWAGLCAAVTNVAS